MGRFLVLVLLTVGSAPALKHPLRLQQATAPFGVNRDWLQKDCDLLWRVRRALPPDPNRFTLVGLPEYSLPEAAKAVLEGTTDLGCGIVRHHQHAWGGYFTCHITSVTYGRALVSMRIVCSGDPPNSKETRSIIEQTLGDGFHRIDRPTEAALEYRADYHFPRAERRARAILDQQLGPLTSVDVPANLAAAYTTLMSPVEELTVGTGCGILSRPPAGAKEMQALRAAHRLDLLRNVLRGPNPEGRIYALRALRELDALDANDGLIANRIGGLAISIERCDGCFYLRGTIDEALRAAE